MFDALPSTGILLLLSLVFSGVALVIGFGLGAWFFGSYLGEQPSNDRSKQRDAELQRAAERAMMASQRIQDLAKNMVSDVDAHSLKVSDISTDLQALTSGSPTEGSEAVFSTISRIVAANNELQSRLEHAEKQIQAQTADLRSYQNEARTDSLTGLANRRAFDDELKRRLAEWQRHRTPFSLLLLDIDHFKQFNDTHGHLAGDEVLRNVGKVLVKAARQMDLPCRYGGEEFAVILPGTDIPAARIVAERVRKAVEAAVVKFEGKLFSVTCSIGVARIANHDDAAKLIRHADDALYTSKEAGRNCGHWYNGTECLPVNCGAPQAGAESDTKLIDTLASKSTIVETMRRRVLESQRFGIPLSVMYLRVDDYANFCQQYGKSVARLALDSVAVFTQSVLREMDLLARLDDGEFIILLPGSTLGEAKQVAKRLQVAASSAHSTSASQNPQLGVSHGIAELRSNETAEQIMARAKAAVDSEESQQQPIGH